MPTQTTSNA